LIDKDALWFIQRCFISYSVSKIPISVSLIWNKQNMNFAHHFTSFVFWDMKIYMFTNSYRTKYFVNVIIARAAYYPL
jgi:hypothetical protein